MPTKRKTRKRSTGGTCPPAKITRPAIQDLMAVDEKDKPEAPCLAESVSPSPPGLCVYTHSFVPRQSCYICRDGGNLLNCQLCHRGICLAKCITAKDGTPFTDAVLDALPTKSAFICPVCIQFDKDFKDQPYSVSHNTSVVHHVD